MGAGVNRTLLHKIGDAIIKLNQERNYMFCLIEHDMEFVARLCDPVICMAEGSVLAEGNIDDVKNNEQVSRLISAPGRDTRNSMSFLLGEHMTGGYGATDILHDCSIGVEKGEIAVIVGPNGAGKSTAMKAVFECCPETGAYSV